MGLNLDVFKQLVTFIDLADGFTLAIAEVNFAADEDLIMHGLRRHEISQAVNLIELEFSTRNDYSLFEELRRELAILSPDSTKPLVVLVRGLATAIGVKGNYTKFLNDLNFRRDVMAAEVPYPMVWFLPDYAINRLAKNAKDLWSWHSALFEFRTTKEMVTAAQTQISQPTPGQLPDAKIVKQERIEQLERLLSVQSEDRKSCIDIALELGSGYAGLSDLKQARKYYRKALDWADAEAVLLQQAHSLLGLGRIDKVGGHHSNSLSSYEQALGLYRDVGDRLGEANTLKAVGDVLQFLDRRQEALSNYEQALGLYRDVGERLGEANTYFSLGRLYLEKRQRDESIKYQQQARNLFRAIGAIQGEANSHRLLGNTYRTWGEYPNAIKSYRLALPLYERNGDLFSQGAGHYDLAEVLVKSGQPLNARTTYEIARDFYQTAGLTQQAEQCTQAIKHMAEKIVENPIKAPTIGQEPSSMATSMAAKSSKSLLFQRSYLFYWFLAGMVLALLLWWLL